MQEMIQQDFAGIFYLLTVWGRNPEVAPAHASQQERGGLFYQPPRSPGYED